MDRPRHVESYPCPEMHPISVPLFTRSVAHDIMCILNEMYIPYECVEMECPIMEKSLGITELREVLGNVFDEVQYQDASFIVERRGKPAGVIVPVQVV